MTSLVVRLVCVLVVVLFGAARSADAASLVLSSGSLQLETASGSGATATVSLVGGNIVITASEVIALGSLPSWTGSGTTTVTGPASVMTAGFLALAFDSITFASDFATPGGALTINPRVLLATNVHLSAASGITLGGLDSTVDGSPTKIHKPARCGGTGEVIRSRELAASAPSAGQRRAI